MSTPKTFPNLIFKKINYFFIKKLSLTIQVEMHVKNVGFINI